MSRLELLLKLVEFSENGESEKVEALLAGRTHNELSSIASSFRILEIFVNEAPRAKEIDLDEDE